MIGPWYIKQSPPDPIDDSQKIGAVRFSDNDSGHLIAGCYLPAEGPVPKGRGFAMGVIWDGAIAVNSLFHQVQIRFPPTPARVEKWQRTSKNSTFSRNPIEFASELVSNKKLVIRIDPSFGDQVTATFDLEGAQEALEPVAEACGVALQGADEVREPEKTVLEE